MPSCVDVYCNPRRLSAPKSHGVMSAIERSHWKLLLQLLPILCACACSSPSKKTQLPEPVLPPVECYLPMLPEPLALEPKLSPDQKAMTVSIEDARKLVIYLAGVHAWIRSAQACINNGPRTAP